MLLPKREEIRSSTAAPTSLLPFSYRDSCPWLIPSCRAKSACFVSKPRSSRKRLPTAFQSIFCVVIKISLASHSNVHIECVCTSDLPHSIYVYRAAVETTNRADQSHQLWYRWR